MDHSIVAAGSRRPRPILWLRAHPIAADLILALLMTATTVTIHLLNIEQDAKFGEARPPSWWTVVLVIASVLPIARRRINPIATVLVVVVAQVTVELFDIFGPGFVGVVVAVYSLGAHSSGRRRTRTTIAIGSLISVLLIAGLSRGELDVGALVWTVVVHITAFVLGDNLRRRRDAAQAIQDRLENAERERELIAHQRVAAERTRIARELHDVVAHSVSVMVIQAAAARRSLQSSPASAEEALQNIEVTGRQTMNELRSILGVLRRNEADGRPLDGGSGSDRTPQPTLLSVSSLVAASPDLPLDLSIDGDIAGLPSSIDLTGYRIIQEAITNVRRHAGTVSHVGVQIRREADAVTIEVTDDGRGAAADDTGTGYGIQGMRERIEAIGGTLATGAQRGGGWRVTASLPAPPPATSPKSVDAGDQVEAASDEVLDVSAQHASVDADIAETVHR